MVMSVSDDSMGGDAVCPNSPENTEEDSQKENLSAAEFEFLDSKLDDLNSALDFIEKKNDAIHEQLLALLHSNREVRKEIQNENVHKGNEDGSENGSSTSN